MRDGMVALDRAATQKINFCGHMRTYLWWRVSNNNMHPGLMNLFGISDWPHNDAGSEASSISNLSSHLRIEGSFWKHHGPLGSLYYRLENARLYFCLLISTE